MTFVAWATLVAALVAAGGSVFGAVLQRRTGREATAISETTAAETDRRAKREELMRVLRWAAELAVDEDEAKAELGLRQLQSLWASPLLDAQMVPQLKAALAAVVDDAAEEVDEIRTRGASPAAVEADHAQEHGRDV